MIVPLALLVRFAATALPLLVSMRGALPSMPVAPLVHRASSAAGAVLELAASIERGGITDVSTDRTATGSTDSQPAAGAGLVPAPSGSTSATTSGSRSKGKKSATAGATGETGATGADGATGGDAPDAARGSDAEGDSDHHSESDNDDDWDREDAREERERAGMRRSITPDLSFGMNPVHVPAGEYHRDNIVCIGGEVTIDGEVRGDIVVVGGVLTITGRVRGEVVAVASKVHLADTAYIRRDFVSVSGPVDRAPNARISGEFHSIDLPNLGQFATGHGVFLYLFSLFFWIGVILTAIRFMAVLVVAAIAPGRVEGALTVPRVSWIFAFFLGFVVHVFATIVGLLLILPILTSPIGLALWLGVRVVVWMGLAAIYLEVGRNISKTVFGNRLSYFGSILLGFSIFAVIGLIPILGCFVTGIMSSTALGLMLLTRFGSRGRLPYGASLPSPAPMPATVPPTSPAPPPTGAATAPDSAL